MKSTRYRTEFRFLQAFFYRCLAGLLIGLAATGCQGASKKMPLNQWAKENPNVSIVRINATQQGYNFHRPWQQLPPKTRTAIGVVIEGPRVLVTASIIANQRYIELEKIDSGEKSSARLLQVDYEANLALVEPEDTSFLKGMQPLRIMSDAVQGNSMTVWQVKPDGTVVNGEARLTAVELVPYSYQNKFLVYRFDGSLQFQFENITMPVIQNGQLAGLVKRYDSKRQTIDVIPAPVIEHFITDAADGEYLGFPKAGIRLGETEDPQLRRYIGLPDHIGGVYVEGVIQNSAAEIAGIRKGDVIFRIAGYDVDRRGNYRHPIFDRVSLTHLIRCGFFVGDKITYQIFRSGKILSIDVMAEHRSAKSFLVPPYIMDKPPRYYILGGLVFQELSASYLREYGKNWSAKAPTYLVYYENNQDFLERDPRKKIVILTAVLPTSYTIGYETLSDLVVTRINDQPVLSLDDIPEKLKAPVNGFHKIEFEQRPKCIYLDPAELSGIDRQIKQRYKLNALKNLSPY